MTIDKSPNHKKETGNRTMTQTMTNNDSDTELSFPPSKKSLC